MKNIIKTNKRGIIVILTLCMLFNTIGICVHATAIPEDDMATPEETTVVVEETVVTTEESIIVTKENVVVTEENAQELMPMMARGCGYPSLNQFLNQYASTCGYYINAVQYGYNIPLSDGYYYHAGQYGSNLQCFIYDSSGDCVASNYLSGLY